MNFFPYSAYLTFGVGLVAVMSCVTSQAQSNQGTYEQRRACEKDAFKFCRKEIPDVPRITECMHINRKNLSPPCRALFAK